MRRETGRSAGAANGARPGRGLAAPAQGTPDTASASLALYEVDHVNPVRSPFRLFAADSSRPPQHLTIQTTAERRDDTPWQPAAPLPPCAGLSPTAHREAETAKAHRG